MIEEEGVQLLIATRTPEGGLTDQPYISAKVGREGGRRLQVSQRLLPKPDDGLGGKVMHVNDGRAYRTITLGGGAGELLHSRVLRKATVPIG